MFSLSLRVQTGSGARPLIQRESGALSPQVKLPGREDHPSPPSSAEVKDFTCISTTTYVFMVWRLIHKLSGTNLSLCSFCHISLFSFYLLCFLPSFCLSSFPFLSFCPSFHVPFCATLSFTHLYSFFPAFFFSAFISSFLSFLHYLFVCYCFPLCFVLSCRHSPITSFHLLFAEGLE
jgi:hypothetical protein